MKCKHSYCDNIVGDQPNTQYLDTPYCSVQCYEGLTQEAKKVCGLCGWAFPHSECPTKAHSLHQGLRYNEGKPRVDLIPAAVLIELGKHYTYGANKYAPNNWVKGFPYSETSGSLLRHLYAWLAGERDDPESGHHHLIAVIWNAVTLFYFELFPEKYAQFDDRVRVSVSKGDFFSVATVNGPVPIPNGLIMLGTGDRIPQDASYYDPDEMQWKTVPNEWVTTLYKHSMGPVVKPYRSDSIKISATEIRK